MDFPAYRQPHMLGRVSQPHRPLTLHIMQLTIFRALRHRYNLPIVLPPSTSTTSLIPKPSSLPTRTPGPSPLLDHRPSISKADQSLPPKSKEGQRIDFDPGLVAKKGEGWEEMFELVLQRWLDEASLEARAGLV